jgi:hypothetical protein
MRRVLTCCMLLPACALVAPRPRRCSTVTCAAKSKKKAKAEFKPPPPELSRPIDVFSRRDSHAVSAEVGERAAIALRIGVEELRSLEASVAVERSGRGGDVTLRGELAATVAQKSVTAATGDLVVSDVTAPIDFWVVVSDGDGDIDDDDRDVVETSDGMVDLGEIVVQTLSLEVDPYPGTGTASGEPVASYGDLEDSQPIIVDDSLLGGDLDLS